MAGWRGLRLQDPLTAWKSLLVMLWATAEQLCPQSHDLDQDDLSQEVLMRMVQEERLMAQAPGQLLLSAWLGGLVRNVLRETRRHEARRAHALRSYQVLQRLEVLAPAPAEQEAIQKEEKLQAQAHVLACAHGLPHPYREILLLRGLHGASNANLTAYLQAWRHVTPRRCRQLEHETLLMARAWLSGKDPRQIWPRRFSQRNRWSSPPPLPETFSDQT